MNELQKGIFEVILSILKCDYIFSNEIIDHEKKRKLIDHGSIRYGLLNYVAKYSLANDKYYITNKAFMYLKANDLLDKNEELRRGKKKSVNSKTKKKYQFTYEHPVPSNVISDYLVIHRKDDENIKNILSITDAVTVLTDEEDAELSRNKLIDKMPPGWDIFEGDIFERYKATKTIEIPNKKINVYGAIKR